MRLSRTVARTGRAIDLGRAEQIVVGDDLRRGRLRNAHHVVQRDHLVRIGAHIELLDVAGLAAEALVGLHVNAIGAIVEIEVVDVRRAHVHLQRVADLLDGHLQAAGLGAIDVHHELRIVGREGAEQAAEILARVPFPHQALGDVIELFHACCRPHPAPRR